MFNKVHSDTERCITCQGTHPRGHRNMLQTQGCNHQVKNSLKSSALLSADVFLKSQ